MALLRRLSMGESVLVAEKGTVTSGVLTVEEFTICINAYRPLAPVEGRARVKRASLVPLSIAVAAVQAFGRFKVTTDLLKGLGEQPLLWQKKDEQEANRLAFETDLLLEDEIREMEGECDVHLAMELESMPSFKVFPEDEDAAQSWTLKFIPSSLDRELVAYSSYRSAPLNRQRDGVSVMEITAAGDRQSALRFLGYLHSTKGVRPGITSVFGSEDVGEWAEEYMTACRERGLKWSSIANYINSLVSITRYALSTMADPPLETEGELIRLRSQAESQAKVERCEIHPRSTVSSPTHSVL